MKQKIFLLCLLLLLFPSLTLATIIFEDDGSGSTDPWIALQGGTWGYNGGSLWVYDNDGSSSRGVDNQTLGGNLTGDYIVNITDYTYTFGPTSCTIGSKHVGIISLYNLTGWESFALLHDCNSGGNEYYIYASQSYTEVIGKTYVSNDDFYLVANSVTQEVQVNINGVSYGNYSYNASQAVQRIFLGTWTNAPRYNISYNHIRITGSFQSENPAVNITPLLPLDNNHTNVNPLNFTYNISSSGGTADNVTLYINGTVNRTILSVADGINNISSTIGEGVWSWFLSANYAGNQTNTTTRTLIVDSNAPVWTVNPSNFFATDNGTSINRVVNPTSLFNLTLSDVYVFAYNVTIIASNSSIMFTNQTTSITSSVENMTALVNMTSWITGEYTVTLYGEDDHTAKTIPSYGHSGFAGGMEWETDTGVTIRVSTPGGTFTTEKLVDRYTFDIDFSSPRNSIILLLKSSEPLYYRDTLYLFPSFVTGQHWVDFNINGITSYSAVDQGFEDGFYKYQVRVDAGNTDLWEFTSLGGLNNITNSYSFIVNNAPPQVENLTTNKTGTTWINLTWDEPPYANGSTLYNGTGAVLYNQTSGVTWFNVTGLLPSTTHTFWVYSFYNDSGTAAYNYSNSSENNITIGTIGNGTITINIYNEVTEQLITENISISLAATGYESEYSTITGSISITDLNPNNYTASASNANYTQRTTNFEVTGDNSSTNLYLVKTAGVTILTYINDETTATLEDVWTTMYSYINGTKTVVETRSTDFTGKAAFSYATGYRYDFESTKTGYATKAFTLNPVLFDTYTVRLSPTTVLTEAPDYTGVTVLFNPKAYTENASTPFTIQFSSPDGLFTSYSYTVSYPGGSDTDSGSSGTGETFTATLNINPVTLTEYVNITYTYDTSISEPKTFLYQYIVQGTAGNYSFLQALKDDGYGMGDLEKMLVATGVVIIVGGMSTLLAGSLIGASIAMALFAFFYFLGFYSLWAVLITFLLGVLIISRRSS